MSVMDAEVRRGVADGVVAPGARGASPAKAWSRALERTASIAANPHRTLPVVLAEIAGSRPGAPALVADAGSLTYAELIGLARRYARWALAHGVRQGDAVALLMPNAPDYFAAWLGITEVGGVVALLNVHLRAAALAHSIDVVMPAHVIVAAGLADALVAAGPHLECVPTRWVHGGDRDGFARIEQDLDGRSSDALDVRERRSVTIDDRALCIYTSGTTGLPKAAIVSHARLMQWTQWFAGLMGIVPEDRMYNCLPMYHSVGGVLSTGSVLAAGGSVVIREKFSVAEFWRDVVRWDCTLFQYVGELCRYLLHAPPDPSERAHRLRLCCGNGLSGDVWTPFQERFQIPQILEFYASTEGNVSLFNVEGRPGAIGRIPAYLAHRFPAALIRIDPDTGQPLRDGEGWCQRCAVDEVGEAIGAVLADRSNIGSRFDGYTSPADSERKILRDVFRAGDAWIRTGDLMRRDAQGFFSFVDRIGDTFRWKGENVATAEVTQAIAAFPGVRDAVVYGVAVPGAEGRAGMAALVVDEPFDLAAFRRYLADRLPEYARPIFLRFRAALDMTATFKPTSRTLAAEGYDPDAVSDVLWMDDRRQAKYVVMDRSVYDAIAAGRIRL
jgi:fatty-acyl-CoA synthase